MYYIEEIDKPNCFTKIMLLIKLQNEKIILPIEKIKEKQAKKLADKTEKILKCNNSKKVVVSKKIKKQEMYVNYLHSKNIEIVDGKWLFEIMSPEVLEYIAKYKNIKKEEIQVSILVNDVTEIVIENIKNIAQNYKKVNIVTNHINKLRKIEEQIYEQFGIMITVTNNKKKSLLKSEIILNIDFPEEIINQYQINENASIVNIQGNVKILKKRFNGININNFEIVIKNEDYKDYQKEEKFEQKDLYEAMFYKKQPYKEVKEKIKKDNIQIKHLVGNNVKISIDS